MLRFLLLFLVQCSRWKPNQKYPNGKMDDYPPTNSAQEKINVWKKTFSFGYKCRILFICKGQNVEWAVFFFFQKQTARIFLYYIILTMKMKKRRNKRYRTPLRLRKSQRNERARAENRNSCVRLGGLVVSS